MLRGDNLYLVAENLAMKIGIVREEKIPGDSRTPLTPSQCVALMERYPDIQVVVQPSRLRCFTDAEYRYHHIPLQEDLSDCAVLLGVKEVPVSRLIFGKTYLFFSHTIKEQPHNRGLMRALLNQHIRMIDYECLKDEHDKRLIAFGRWAGIVGAYHAVRMIGFKSNRFRLRQMIDCLNFAEAQKEFEKLDLPPWKIVLTGTGRVSEGADFLLECMGIRKVTPRDFLYRHFDELVYTQLSSQDMYYKQGQETFDATDYHAHPSAYSSAFYPFTKAADVMINGIYWDKRIPVFFSREQAMESDFRIRLMADVTCDIAPDASVPTTLCASSIADPYYGYDPKTGMMCPTFQPNSLDVMAIDNLPNELPRDASEDFGNMLITRIIPELRKTDSAIIRKATITQDGRLGSDYVYLSHYAGATT